MINMITDSWKLEDIELVIFDKDGTFIDIHKYWGRVVELRAQKAIQYFALPDTFFEPLCEVMGYDLASKKLPPTSPVGLYARGKVQDILLYYLISQNIDASPEDIETIFAEVNQEFLAEQEDYTTTIPSAIEFIKKLEGKVRMVVVTSDSKTNAQKTVEQNGLSSYFEDVFGAEDSKTSKATGDIVKKIIKKTKVKPENVICIGDTYDDYLMAKKSGIKACVNVSTGVVPKTEHETYNDFCIEQLSEIELFN